MRIILPLLILMTISWSNKKKQLNCLVKDLNNFQKKVMKVVMLFAFLISTWNLIGQEVDCNYIEDYHPLTYKAQVKYYKGEYEDAYRLLDEARSKCELLNQPNILETIIFAELSGRRGLFDQAFYYLEKALKEGFNYQYLEGNQNLVFLHNHPSWKRLKEKSAKYLIDFENSINQDLRNEIINILQADQSYRMSDRVNEEEDVLMLHQDSINQVRMKEIFELYGYPNSNLIGWAKVGENTDIRYTLMHFKDTAYFRPRLQKFIANGHCSPYVLAFMIDSWDRGSNTFTYGIYNDVDSTMIKDFKNLDERRKTIGLRPWKMEMELRDLLIERYKN